MQDLPLLGLILAGGKSTRMGEDKGKIQYRQGVDQRILMARLLANYCKKIFISCRMDQQNEDFQEFSPLMDIGVSTGPMSGLHSAFNHDKNAAWFILPCDLPLFTSHNLSQLLQNRDKNKIATVFKSPCGQYIEPLVGIWEPIAFPMIESNYIHGKYSLNQILKENQIALVTPFEASGLTNVNTPVEKRDLLLEHPSVQF